MRRISVPISAGELVDKITILEIKQARLPSPVARANVSRELAALQSTLMPLLAAVPALADHQRALYAVNEMLWGIEDDIRACEAAKDFGETFIALARAVYRTNDRRAAIKRRIDEAAGSEIVEEKSYQNYE
jgi:uncharacterized protein DUF6165